jgi:hypothetical protein
METSTLRKQKSPADEGFRSSIFPVAWCYFAALSLLMYKRGAGAPKRR